MGKNGYGGTEVYISKLNEGTEFRCNNGAWDGKFIIEDEVPKIIIDGGTVSTISENKVLNITTDEKIPMEAYVYKSVYYAVEFKQESERLNKLYWMIKDVLLTKEELNTIDKNISLCIANLNYIHLKFKEMIPENYH